MIPSQHAQDDLITIIALVRYSYQFEAAEPRNADRAWQMAMELADQHRLDPTEAVHQFEAK
ncbi:hypothetical protein [Natronosalvus rutilus]|uniref:Uncharacterized protein n=1 Tax=Natronosalvus rutilus TaxID=2953753 RepID=A0A9E7N9H7_9EURY|nr:hypothetical protein [Natronosalvus rutilus]UTF53266.1 hypothetical protein NGM29_16055 [Natronosalvus rutilus]